MTLNNSSTSLTWASNRGDRMGSGMVPGSDGRFILKDTGSNCGNLSHTFRNNSVLDIQKMEVLPDGRIAVWQTLTEGDAPSQDRIVGQ